MFGELKKVPLRDIWPREASDFTPWIAQNLEELGKALGMDLELTETEADVGDFALDVLAKDLGTAHTVIIENQLTQTDHDHLGKLLTYAAGFDASTIIWISESIREEHRQAIDWLNQRTDGETLFFGVVVGLIKIDESRPAFTFSLAASPNEWQKNRSRTAGAAVSSKGEKYRAYFQSLIDELRERYSFTAAKAGQPQNWYTFASGTRGVSYGANFTSGGKARAELYIDLEDFEKNKYVFDELEREKSTIESMFDEPVSWERLDDKRASRLAFYCDAAISDSDSDLEQIHAWHIEKLLQIKEHLGPKVSPIATHANNVM